MRVLEIYCRATPDQDPLQPLNLQEALPRQLRSSKFPRHILPKQGFSFCRANGISLRQSLEG